MKPPLSEALLTAYHTRPQWRASMAEREAERDRIAAEHQALYAELLK